MIELAWGISCGVLILAAALRVAGASLVRTPRADALHDAADGVPGAVSVAELLEDRASIQPSISLIHSALLVASALSAAWAIATLSSGWILVTALILTGVALVVFGEWLPRSLGRERPRVIAYRLARLLRVAVRAGERAVDLIYDEEDDVNSGADANGDHDASDREEIRMISSVLEFSYAIVREVMTPRTDMVTLGADLTTTEALDLILEYGFSRVPVTGRGADDIVGLVYAKDLLHLVGEPAEATPLAEIIRPPYFVPETKPVRDLLREMQSSQFHMAVAVDEFGGTAGLVTIEDLIEELVGEIVDEYDTEPPMVEPLEAGVFLVDARLPVDDLAGLLDTHLPDGEWDTVGGLVLGLAGRVPIVGERFEFDGAVLIPERVQGRRVERVRVSHLVGTQR
ncbi:MAG: hemolysin family protein [bacterium]|nr:hemolysin family protein [bacterium]MDE0288285.1 hemolysin family protein [bacterium]MDE0437313.1 hemolysin family protein [bacterium]